MPFMSPTHENTVVRPSPWLVWTRSAIRASSRFSPSGWPQEVHSRPGCAETKSRVGLVCLPLVVAGYPQVSSPAGGLDRPSRERRAAPAAPDIGMHIDLRNPRRLTV